MKEYQINCAVKVLEMEELDAKDRELVENAMKATETSYSPYSHFQVGAALRLEDDTIVRGSNQENASYPIGCCAERTALFWTGANHPGKVIKAIAIAAQTEGHFTENVTGPCGMCRQAMLEYEHKQGEPMRVLLYSTNGIHIIERTEDLMPFSFYAESME